MILRTSSSITPSLMPACSISRATAGTNAPLDETASARVARPGIKLSGVIVEIIAILIGASRQPMKRYSIFAAALLLTTAATAATNALTPEEKSAGWILLFDGKSMTGWVDQRQKTPPGDAWSIEDGALKATSKPRIREDLFSEQTFRDFDLVFDWRISPAGNSGVKYRIQDHLFVLPRQPDEKFEASVQRTFEHRTNVRPDKGEDYVVGFEYQMTDDSANADAKGNEKHTAGALYDIVGSSKPGARPVT